jgi:hypothetical protein
MAIEALALQRHPHFIDGCVPIGLKYATKYYFCKIQDDFFPICFKFHKEIIIFSLTIGFTRQSNSISQIGQCRVIWTGDETFLFVAILK